MGQRTARMAGIPMNTLHPSLPWRHHLREILRLGVPLVGNNLALAAMGTVDTLMSGRLGSRSLAAVAVGVSFYNLFLFAAVGVMMAVSPLIAHARGGSRHGEVVLYSRQALWLALRKAKAWVINFWRISARPMPLPMWCAALKTTM